MIAERQIIGSLILDASRIDDMHGINSEMFTDSTMGRIFSLYALAEGKEVNQLSIINAISSDFLPEHSAKELLIELVNEHDPGISDEYCVKQILDAHTARVVNGILDRTVITPQNVEKVIDELRDNLDGLVRNDDVKAKSLSELASEYSGEYFKEHEGKKIFNFGFEKIDKAIGGLDPGDITVIAARPAVGKSAFTLQAARKFGRDGYRIGYFNLEMGEKQIYERSVASTSGIDMTRIRMATNFLNNEKTDFDKGNATLVKENNLYVMTGTFSIPKIRSFQKANRFDLIIIDYLQLIQAAVKRNNRVNEVGDISRGLKALATDFDIPVIALSQLNRASELNKDKEPSMSELRESGDIEQDASVILMLWNPNPEDTTEKKIKVEKSRNGFTERETLYFDGKHMTFSSVDTGFRKATDEEELQWS